MSVSSRDRVRFEIEAETEQEPLVEGEESTFSIALIGDFSGAAERRPLAARKPIEIDRDNFETIMQRLAPAVALPGGLLRFTSLDHFHPDHLYTHLPEFDALRDLRERLSNPETSRAAIRELLGDPGPRPAPVEGSLLDAIAGGGVPAAAAPAPTRSGDELHDFIRNAVRPYLVDRPDARIPELLRQTDEAAAGVLRAILHAAPFRALESVWRTTFELVRRLETDEGLKIWIIDVPQDEFAADPVGVSRIFVEHQPWAVIASFYSFGSDHIDGMTEAARIARRCGATWLTEGDLSLLDSAAEWTAFRRTPEAAWLGMLLPRILLRMPYGEAASSCEELKFEEIEGKPSPKNMLWGNPAPFCAMLLGQSLGPGRVREIGGLPVYVYKDDEGDPAAMPCAETALTEDTAEALMDYGIMPVVWERHRDAVRVLRFQSVAQPATALQGPWHG